MKKIKNGKEVGRFEIGNAILDVDRISATKYNSLRKIADKKLKPLCACESYVMIDENDRKASFQGYPAGGCVAEFVKFESENK